MHWFALEVFFEEKEFGPLTDDLSVILIYTDILICTHRMRSDFIMIRKQTPFIIESLSKCTHTNIQYDFLINRGQN